MLQFDVDDNKLIDAQLKTLIREKVSSYNYCDDIPVCACYHVQNHQIACALLQYLVYSSVRVRSVSIEPFATPIISN